MINAPLRTPPKSPRAGGAVLIAAASGRALAAAARRSGYRPLVADLFDDDDTRSLCVANLLAGDPRAGFAAETLIAALGGLAEAAEPFGLVYGAGFEDRIDFLEEIAARWRIFGNPPETVRRAKNPIFLAELCRSLDIPHPDISLPAPRNPEGWLVKSVGGAGGDHVAPATDWRTNGATIYFQRVTSGTPASVLCLCNGVEARALGSSRQWTAPAPGKPFRYGGCVRPADLPPQIEKELREAAGSLAHALRLVGLNSVDFLVDGESFTLIEVNPRPGATLDIFEDRQGLLFKAHIDACCGHLARSPLQFAGAAAAVTAYSPREIASMPALDWPQWAADRQKHRTAVALYDPLCTVKACCAESSGAIKLLEQRTALLLKAIDESGMGTAP
jgi:uncharacterized protein